MAYDLIGKNFIPPDVRAKVTGQAKYAEDFRADGMVFCRLLTSPMPHARVRNIDTSAAEKLPGVIGFLTADEVPAPESPYEPVLTNEPLYVGAPILAVAAESETAAEDAIDRIKLDLEPLPFVLDPLESLYPGGPNARSDGNAVNNIRADGPTSIKTHKWTAQDFALAGEERLPQGEPTRQYAYGDLEDAFARSKVVIEESFVVACHPHHSMEPRSAMAYWQNGKCYLHGSSQSQTFPMFTLAQLLGIEVKDLVFIAEYCGGGFGSKGSTYPILAVPAYLSKKLGLPVMMRISRAEEYYIGSARNGFQGHIKLGFAEDGRLLAGDLYTVQDNGPSNGFQDWYNAAEALSLVYQPEALRWRGVAVSTNTPWRSAQRGPGENQLALAVEPLFDRAANELGIDRVEIRRINASHNDSKVGEHLEPVTSSYQRETLEIGAKKFNWQERLKRHGQRKGSKVTAIGVGQAFHPAGFNGFDGLVLITPEGKLQIHTGVGNLGTFSHSATSRVAAEVLKCDWENCVIMRGDSRKHLPFNIGQFGSNTSFTMTRTNYVAARDAVDKLKEITAMDLGGEPGDYDIGGEKVFLKSDPTKHLTYAAVAQRAIELGGKFSGQEIPENLNPLTKMAVMGLAGSGLVGVAKDTLHKEGLVPTSTAGFIEIELDLETGKYEIIDYLGVADCGTIIHPQSLATQIKGGAVMGFGMACTERYVYDPQNGLPANIGFYTIKPASYLDVPAQMDWDAVNKPDPQNPVGAKGVGEPPMGAGGSALLCAISEALGGHYFLRNPVTPDMIVNAAAGRPQSHKPLQVHTQ